MKLLKDLLYNRDNVNLDIARLSAFLGVVGFLAATGYSLYLGGDFEPAVWGTGWAALCGGNAAWIYARQAQEHSKGEGK
jgi:uncharacterized membrane protein YjjB (DUF3815 family)